jgi:hypothetical protein
MFFNDTRLCSSLPALFLLLVTQVLCVQLIVDLKTWDDGTYGYEGRITEEMSPPSPQKMRDWVKRCYELMKAAADLPENEYYPAASAMALLFVWTDTRYNKGVIIAQSSLVGGTNPLARDYLNSCRDSRHRTYGNCAEIGAMSRARQQGISLRDGTLAVYGVQPSSPDPTHVRPCRRARDLPGCNEYINMEGMRSITKRSRVEGIPGAETKEYGIVERAPKHVPSKAPKFKSKSKSATSMSVTSSIPKSPISVSSKSKGLTMPTAQATRSSTGSTSPTAVSTARASKSSNTSDLPTAASITLEIKATMPVKSSKPVATIVVG